MGHRMEEGVPPDSPERHHHHERAAFVKRVRTALRNGTSVVEAMLGDDGGPESGLRGMRDTVDDWIEDARNGRR